MHGRRGLNAPITGATASGTAITYNSPTHTFLAGQVVDISGITPNGFNLNGATIASVVAATSFTIASTVTGTYTKGGNAIPKFFSSLGEVEGHNRYLVAHVRTSVDNGSTTKPIVKNLSFAYLSGLQIPDNWASEVGTNYYLDANTRRFGTKAAKVEVTLAPDGFIYPDRGVTPSDISVVANTTYSFSTYVKFDSPTGANNVRLRVYPAGTIYPASATILADSGPHTDFPADTEGWRRLSVTFRTGGSTAYVRPMIYMVNTAGSLVDYFWVDGVLFEEGTVVRSWTPGFVTSGMTFEGGGMNIDSSAGGVLRLRGSDGGPRDEVTTGTNGLNFGGATSAVQVYSGSASTLNISGDLEASGSITSAGVSLMSNPMTAVGDLIIGGTVTGSIAAPAKLGKGTSGYVLRAGSSTISWSEPEHAVAHAVYSGTSTTGINGSVGSTTTILPLGTTVEGGDADYFTLASNVITVKSAGIYSIHLSAKCGANTLSSTTNVMRTQIRKGSTVIVDKSDNVPSSAANAGTVNSCTVLLAADDTISFYGAFATAETAGANKMYVERASVTRIGTGERTTA
jgi:hypothetical protein